MAKIETRSFGQSPEFAGNKLSGYGAVFGREAEISEGGRRFKEVVMPGAFRSTLTKGQDILVCFNHDPSRLLGRTSSGTAKVYEDKVGLRFEVELPDTQYGKEVRTLVERGDLSGCSFSFSCNKEAWSGQTPKVRQILEAELFECGPVVLPAYDSTNGSLGLRSKNNINKLRLRLNLLKGH